MSNQGTLDDQYLEWLYRRIGVVRNRNPARSYWELAKQLYTMKFTWSVPNDDNRAADGVDLREAFLCEQDLDADDDWLMLDCSVLEMLVALAQRTSFESAGDPGTWFWRMMDHLDLRHYTDDQYSVGVAEEIDHAIQTVLDRTYDRDGRRGLFPLNHARENQRSVELWYQMSAYLLEGGYVDYGV